MPDTRLVGVLDVGKTNIKFSSLLAPPAIWPTIVATVIRLPRMQARPAIISASKVIRSNRSITLAPSL
jgi:hypothetical protein